MEIQTSQFALHFVRKGISLQDISCHPFNNYFPSVAHELNEDEAGKLPGVFSFLHHVRFLGYGCELFGNDNRLVTNLQDHHLECS